MRGGVRGEPSLEGDEERASALPEFHRRLLAAWHALEAADRFDLHSEDPASVRAWEALERAADEARRTLVDYVLARHEDLR